MRAEVESFPGIVLHPPLPSLMHPQDPSAKPHQQSSQAELDTHQTSAETSPSALSGSTIGPPPPLLLQPTPPYEHTVDSDTQTSKIQDSTAQLSTVFIYSTFLLLFASIVSDKFCLCSYSGCALRLGGVAP